VAPDEEPSDHVYEPTPPDAVNVVDPPGAAVDVVGAMERALLTVIVAVAESAGELLSDTVTASVTPPVAPAV
jgi:hypothetical protein